MARKVMTRKFKFFNYEFNLFEVDKEGNPISKGNKSFYSREDMTKEKIISEYYDENFLITNLKKTEVIKSFEMEIDEFIRNAKEVIDENAEDEKALESIKED